MIYITCIKIVPNKIFPPSLSLIKFLAPSVESVPSCVIKHMKEKVYLFPLTDPALKYSSSLT